MQLTGEQRRRLQQALLSAFPTRGALAQLVSFTFNTTLDTLAGGDNLMEATLQVIGWAEAKGRIADLLQGAGAESPGNPDLQAALTLIVLTAPAPATSAGPPATPLPNPFYAGSTHMVGRADEVRRIWGKLRAGNHCSIVGPPSSGKTLMLKVLQAQAPQQMNWTPADWVLIPFRTVNSLHDLQQAIVQELGGERPAQLRALLRVHSMRLLALDDLGWMGAGNEGLKMRRWLRGFAEENTIQLLITSNKALDVLFRADDPTVDSPFENLDKLPVRLLSLPAADCRELVAARLAGTAIGVDRFSHLFDAPRHPKELLDLCANYFEELSAAPGP